MCENLPVEIVEYIFKYLDCASLVRASGVCKLWRNAFLRIVKYKDVFQTCCRLEISPEDLLSIIERIYPNCVLKQNDCVDWEQVYKRWHFNKSVKDCGLLEKCILQEHASKIKCVKMSGNWLIYGTTKEGLLGMINMENLVEGEALFYNCGHGVYDIDLINSLDAENVNNELCHDKVNCLMKDPRKIVSFTIDIINGFGNRKLIYDGISYSSITCEFEWVKSVRSNYYFKMKSLGLNVSHINITVPPKITDKLSICVTNSHEVYLSKYESDNVEDTLFVGNEYIGKWHQLNASVTFAVGFKPYDMVFFIVGEKIKGYLISPEMFRITSAFIYSNMLFLGNNKSTIFMYTLENHNTLLNFDISDYNSYELDSSSAFDDDCVVGFDFQYSKQNIPYLVVATECALYKLTFGKLS